MNPVVRRFVQIGFLVLLQAAVLFGTAGRLNWIEGWVYMGLYLALIALVALLARDHLKEMAAERSQIGKNTKGWDKVIGILIALFGPGMLAVAGFDDRWDWSPRFAAALTVAAFVVVALGYVLFAWAMGSNKYFATTVRIQDERGHAAQTGGAYRVVRHPSYLGLIVYSLATPLALGSFWALIPAALLVVIVVVRTALEDRTLQAELAGYKEYTQQTRYRLLPGIW